jgi:hypothetical protein
MEQEKIKYKDIMNLGFKEHFDTDQVYFDEFGFDYAIITKKLEKRISLDWAKDTQLCEMIRLNKTGSIVSKMPMRNLEHLKEIISFFTDDSFE